MQNKIHVSLINQIASDALNCLNILYQKSKAFFVFKDTFWISSNYIFYLKDSNTEDYCIYRLNLVLIRKIINYELEYSDSQTMLRKQIFF